MKRKSTAFSSAGSDSVELRNTGLRPSWNAFWAVESENEDDQSAKSDYPPTHTISTASAKSAGTIRGVNFVTGSQWYGEWDKLGMCGMGIYKMPHGVVYEGTMNESEFEGIGVLRYPNGGVLEGFWHAGKLKYCTYGYADGLKRDSTVSWPYCKMPDRRFYSELLCGMRPGDKEQLTDEYPTRDIPPGCYDVGDGFYNPSTKCVTDAKTEEVLRIPTAAEEQWILEVARKADHGTVGYRPDLYENWFEELDDSLVADLRDCEQHPLVEHDEADSEMLKLLRQEKLTLDNSHFPNSSLGSNLKSTSVMSKYDYFSVSELQSSSSFGKSSGDFDGFLSHGFLHKIFRDLEERKVATSPFSAEVQSESVKGDGEDAELQKLLKDMSDSYSLKLDRLLSDNELVRESKMDILPSGAVMQRSTTSLATKPLSYTDSTTSFESSKKTSSVKNQFENEDSLTKTAQLSAGTSEFFGSKLEYNVDYSEYETSTKTGED